MAEQTSQPRQRLTKKLRQKKLAPIHTHHWKEMIISAVIGLGVGLILSTIIVRFSFAKVNLAGIPVGTTTTQQQLEQSLAAKLETYQVAIQYPDGTTKNFPLSDMGITVDAPESARNAITRQRPDNYLQRLKWWGRSDVPLVLHVDSAALESFVQAQATQVSTPGKDAAVGIDQGKVVVTPGEAGSGYTITGGAKGISNAVTKLNATPLTLEEQELAPNISDQAAQNTAAQLQTILDQPVTFSINNKQVTAKPSDIGGWIDITPSPANHTIDYSVNSGKVLTYMNTMARQYITPPVTQVALPDGTVIVPGQNGVDITNKESAAANVAQQLMNKNGAAVTLPVQYASYKTITAEPRDKWIVVDITTKRMYAYEQNTLVRSFLVSAGAPATPTVTGQFAVYSKYASQDMRGANADGSRYFQPNVRWVMYFYRDYAIHGNYWRPLSYFGNVNSSHGCVGVVDADAKWLYDWAPIGTTVIVHR